MARRVGKLGQNNVVNIEYLPRTYAPSTFLRYKAKIQPSTRDTKVFRLQAPPILDSEIVDINGLVLSEGDGNDYMIFGATLVLSDELELEVGDLITVKFST